MRSIEKIIVKIESDIFDGTDLEDIGSFSEVPGPDAIDHIEEMRKNGYAVRAGCTHRAFRYFNPAMTAKQTGNPDSPRQDYQRMIDYQEGRWWHCAVTAIARIKIKKEKWGLTNSSIVAIESGTLGGVESDAGAKYFRQVAEEQKGELIDTLTELGFTPKEFDAAPVVFEGEYQWLAF